MIITKCNKCVHGAVCRHRTTVEGIKISSEIPECVQLEIECTSFKAQELDLIHIGKASKSEVTRGLIPNDAL